VRRIKSSALTSNLPGGGIHSSKRVGQRKVFRILLISGAPEDFDALRTILNDPLWHLARVGTCEEAFARLCRKPMSVVVCESDLPDGNWRDVLNRTSQLADPPALIVTSRLADEHLWAEVLNLGGYDVLAKPFREGEVRHVISTAWIQKEKSIPTVRAAATA